MEEGRKKREDGRRKQLKEEWTKKFVGERVEEEWNRKKGRRKEWREGWEQNGMEGRI